MIAQVTGKILEKNPTKTVLDLNGFGLEIHIPVTTYEKLPELGESVTLFTHLHVREDLLQLYGFKDQETRRIFQLVISVSGIGPRTALGILSKLPVSELTSAIMQGNWSVLASAPGIGKKTAQRLVMELKDKLGKEGGEGAEPGPVTSDKIEEAVLALVSLGYRQTEAIKLVQKATKSVPMSTSVEELIKKALKSAAS